MASEVDRAFRLWAREREAEQTEQLRLLDRSLGRLADIDRERVGLVAEVESALARLAELGLGAEQVTAFIGADPRSGLVGGGGRGGPNRRRRAVAVPVSGSAGQVGVEGAS